MEDKSIIKFGEKTFTASQYQEQIFTEIEQGCGNMVITAAAGSAKTSTIENCLRFIAKDKKALFLAFNVSTVQKLKDEIVTDNDVKIMTFHGLGNRILRENEIITTNTLIDDFKYSRYVKANLKDISEYGEYSSLGNLAYTYLNNVLDLVDYCRYYLSFTIKEIARTAEIYGISPVRDEYEVVRKVLLWGKQNIQSIDNTDMIWLPNVLNLETKFYRYDFIFIDEAQDTTIAHQSMVDKCFRRATRFIAVGDPKQQINVWCGATQEAIKNYLNRPNTKHLTLPISYRCPKLIVEKAKYYSKYIEAKEGAIQGVIREDVSLYDAKGGDIILCRVISKLVEAYLKLLKGNKKAYLKGNDAVKETFLGLINSVNATRIDVGCVTSDGLITQLYKTYFDLKYKYIDEMNIDENDVMYRPDLVNLYDNIEALKILSDGIFTVDELTEKVKVIFNGDEKDAIMLSTIHKAKGLEADNIFILCPSLMSNKMAKKDWEIEAEANLNYVAITRAKISLNYIKEEKRGFFYNFWGSTDMKSELDKIERKIGYKRESRAIKDNEKKEVEKTDNVQDISGKSKFKLCNLIKK